MPLFTEISADMF